MQRRETENTNTTIADFLGGLLLLGFRSAALSLAPFRGLPADRLLPDGLCRLDFDAVFRTVNNHS